MNLEPEAIRGTSACDARATA